MLHDSNNDSESVGILENETNVLMIHETENALEHLMSVVTA